MTHPHPCLYCGQAADLPVLDETAEMYGWICRPCDRKQRMKRMGWRGRMKRKARRLLNL